MTLKLFSILLIIIPVLSHGQSVQVRKEISRIHGTNIPGYQVAFTATEEEVQNSLSRYLRTMGKTKQSDGVISIAEPLIAGKKYADALYGSTKQIGTTTAAWIGMNIKSGEESSLDRDLEKLAYDFGLTFQRDKIQLQIDESLRALQTVQKQQARLINQNKDLNNKIENNKREKIHLEKSLITNKDELEDLSKKLEGNTRAQDSVAIAADQIRKVLDLHKERQQKVH